MKPLIRAISFLLIMLIILAAVASCANTTAPPMQESTEKLVIYDAPMYTALLRKAIAIFKQEFPWVEVEFREFGSLNLMNPASAGNIESYIETLTAELAAGRGPDVLVWSVDYSPVRDLHKAVDTGVFADLNPFINNDDTFALEDYNKPVLDSGVFGGNRYIMPLFYDVSLWMTTQEILNEAGIAIEDMQTFPEAAGHIAAYFSDNQSSEKTIFNWPWVGWSWFLMKSGLMFVDYEQGHAAVDGQDFKTAMEIYKLLSEQDQDLSRIGAINYTDSAMIRLINKEYLFDADTSRNMYYFLDAYSRLQFTQTPVFINNPTFNGNVVGAAQSFGAILENSENKVNAYEFLKILLADEIQSDENELLSSPVLYSALLNKVDSTIASLTPKEGDAGSVERGFSGGDPRLVPIAIPDDIVNKYIRMVWDVDVCINVSPMVKGLVLARMTPYFLGERSYEDCLAELTTALTLYLHE